MTSIAWIGYTLDLDIARKIDAAADRAGVPRNVLRAIVLGESGGDPNNYTGDGGLSVGLLQLHAAYQGRGMSIAERQDPDLNLAEGVPYIAEAWRATAGVTPTRERVKVAAGMSGHPNSSEAGEAGREKIARLWERLEREGADPAGTLNVAGMSINPERLGEQATRLIAFVQDRPLEAAAVALGAAVLLLL